MLHDFEEIITVEKWARRTESKIKDTSKWIDKRIWNFWNISSHSFAKRDFLFLLQYQLLLLLKYNTQKAYGV